MTSASLSNGIYLIKGVKTGSFVGRHPVEDRSLLPKRVLALEDGVQAPRWTLEKDEDSYILKAAGAPVGVDEDLVFAHLVMSEERGEKWKLSEHMALDGKTVYAIRTNSMATAWTVESSGYAGQVKLKPFETPIDASQAFEIIRVSEE